MVPSYLLAALAKKLVEEKKAKDEKQAIQAPPPPQTSSPVSDLQKKFEEAGKLADVLLPKTQPPPLPKPPRVKLHEFSRRLWEGGEGKSLWERILRGAGAFGLELINPLLPGPDPHQYELLAYQQEKEQQERERAERASLVSSIAGYLSQHESAKAELVSKAYSNFISAFRRVESRLGADREISKLLQDEEPSASKIVRLSEPISISRHEFLADATSDAAAQAIDRIVEVLRSKGAEARSTGDGIEIQAIPVSVKITVKSAVESIGERISKETSGAEPSPGGDITSEVINQIRRLVEGGTRQSETSGERTVETVEVINGITGSTIARAERQVKERTKIVKQQETPKEEKPATSAQVDRIFKTAPPNVEEAIQNRDPLLRSLGRAMQSVLGSDTLGRISNEARNLLENRPWTDAVRELSEKLKNEGIRGSAPDVFYHAYLQLASGKTEAEALRIAGLIKGIREALLRSDYQPHWNSPGALLLAALARMGTEKASPESVFQRKPIFQFPRKED